MKPAMRVFAMALLLALPTAAQAYPTKPVRIVVPVSPGSAVDAFARQLAGPLAEALGQPIVIDNQPGSAGLIGLNQILRSARDGHTLGMVANTFVIAPNLYKLPFDPARDFVPVAILNSGPLVLVINPKVPANDVGEFIALAKSRPSDSTLTIGNVGVGTTVHMAAELLASSAGITLLHVPYKGNNTYTTDLIGGQVDAGFLGVAVALPYIKSGRLRALGISTPTRLGSLPDVPTMSESGLPGFDIAGWQALIVPTGTPKDVIQRLNTEVVRVLKTREMETAVGASGGRVVASTVEEAAEWFTREFDRYAKLSRRLGLKPE